MSRPRREILGLASIALCGLAGCLGESQSSPAEDPASSPAQGGSDDPSEPVAESDVPREADPAVSAAQLETLAEGLNAFAVDLLAELVAEEPAENLFASPVSISLALAMAWAGATEETETQMADALRYPFDQEQLHPAFNAFDQSLAAAPEDDAELTLEIANAIWGQEEFPFRESYLDTLARNYGAGIRRQDFRDHPERARETINEWVADETEGEIPTLLPEGSLTRRGDDFVAVVLTNAIYFLADWKYAFDESNTEARTFTAIDGTTDEVELMRQQFRVPYAAVDGHQVIDLPYVGERLSMTVILPAEGEFDSFRRQATGERVSALIEATEPQEGTLWLPHFEFSTDFTLSNVLASMGMDRAFTPGAAQFDAMFDRSASDIDPDQAFALDEVFHEAFVAVDEEGTEATAATAVVGGVTTTSAGGEPDPFEMVVDRPFLFALRDRETGTLLFYGQVVDAAAVQG